MAELKQVNGCGPLKGFLLQKPQQIEPGIYFVATPIGAARDITLRALDILSNADVIAAEDTRVTKKLLQIHGISLGGRKLLSFHDHSSPTKTSELLAYVEKGLSVAVVSDAGTPMISDPGYNLATAAISNGVPIFAAPGPSALLAALCISGMPTNQFFFAGFIPNKSEARRKFLKQISPIETTIILYETSKRILKCIDSMQDVFESQRTIAVCRELTKKFETIYRGSFEEVKTALENAGSTLKGEIVVVLSPPEHIPCSEEEIDDLLTKLMIDLRTKDAATEASKRLNLPKKGLYQRALYLQGNK